MNKEDLKRLVIDIERLKQIEKRFNRDATILNVIAAIIVATIIILALFR